MMNTLFLITTIAAALLFAIILILSKWDEIFDYLEIKAAFRKKKKEANRKRKLRRKGENYG